MYEAITWLDPLVLEMLGPLERQSSEFKPRTETQMDASRFLGSNGVSQACLLSRAVKVTPHREQLWSPGLLNSVGSQSMQAVVPVLTWCVPAAQRAHTVLALWLEYSPAEHWRQRLDAITP